MGRVEKSVNSERDPLTEFLRVLSWSFLASWGLCTQEVGTSWPLCDWVSTQDPFWSTQCEQSAPLPVWNPAVLSASLTVVGVFESVSAWRGRGNKMSPAPPRTYEKHITWVRKKTRSRQAIETMRLFPQTPAHPAWSERCCLPSILLLSTLSSTARCPSTASPVRPPGPTGPVSHLPNQSPLRN